VSCGSWGGNRKDHNNVDIGIDQIVPTSKLGTEYVAVRGASNNNTHERVMIVAHENNTEVYVKGQATPIATIAAAGATKYIPMLSSIRLIPYPNISSSVSTST